MMDDQALRDRIAQLEKRLDAALDRIDQLESKEPKSQGPAETSVHPTSASSFTRVQPSQPDPAPIRTTPPPPPVRTSKPASVEPVRLPTATKDLKPAPKLNPPTIRPPKKRDFALLEYNLGAKVLPWAGAILTIIALGIFVSLGIERGLITPPMQLGGAILLSIGFMLAGFKKHEEKEDFGKILIAVGSCGMFISFAGGHVFLKLYPGATMIGLFLAWSALNLVYGQKTRSTAFVLLGFFGGMIAALMPLTEQNYLTSMALQFMIVVPSMLIGLKQADKRLVLLFWGVGFLALLPSFFASGLETASAVAIVAHALIAVLAYVLATDRVDFDPGGVYAGAMPGITSLLILGRGADWGGLIALLGLGIPLIAIGIWRKYDQVRGPILVAGLASTFVLAPICIQGPVSTFTFLTISLLASGIILRKRWDLLLPIVWIDFTFGVFSFLYNQGAIQKVAPALEIVAVSLIGVTLVAACFVTSKVKTSVENMTALGMIGLVPLLARVFWVMGESLSSDASIPVYSVCFGLLAYLLVLTKFTRRISPTIRAILWLLALVIGFIYGNLDTLSEVQSMPIQVVLTGFAIGVVAVLSVGSYRASIDKEFVSLLCLGVITVVVARFLWTLGILIQPSQLSGTTSLGFGLVAYSLIISQISERAKVPMRMGVWGILALSMVVYVQLASLIGVSFGVELGFLASLVGAILIVERETFRTIQSPEDQLNLIAVLSVVTVVLGRLFWVVGLAYRPDIQMAQVALCYGLLGLLFIFIQLFGAKGRRVRSLLWCILAASGAVYGNLFVTVQPGLVYEIPFMLACLAAMFLIGKLELDDAPEDRHDYILGVIGVPFGFALARVFALLMTQTAIGASKVNGSTMALALVSAIAALLVYRRSRLAFGGLMWIFAASSLASTARLVAFNPPMEAVILMLVMLTLCGWASTRLEPLRQIGPVVAMVLNWHFFSRLLGLLIGENVFLNQDLTKTLSWIAYAIILLVVGFWRDQRAVRFGAIALFAGSTLKMFLSDLAQQMDTLARVGILFLLGFAMLGAGYWYLRSRVIEHPPADAN